MVTDIGMMSIGGSSYADGGNTKPIDPQTMMKVRDLLVAAPELLSSLKELVASLIHAARHFGLNEDEVRMLKRAESAIAKAEPK